ncbi:glycosyltransferase family 2 protein [Aliivibrio fischeri]|uniref:glycosyltransferase family 2 protein n=1 Tax=Aliivibrio fischeri TaxID=668 RepID=UPI00080D982F|nr:glycosyltransferase family 2 protein [Aliivibrio fischeri]OCH37523.1 hypothetical protein A6D99_13750 [Aliivibrio fischeri]
MGRNIKISIIIPLYNAELYLNDLFYSLSNQTCDNFEVIFVNDGSTDETYNLVNEFCDDGKGRYKLFNIKNSGVSIARHFGFKKSIGDFVFFIDSDDYISIDTVELLLSNIKSNTTDIVVVDYVKFDKNRKTYVKSLMCESQFFTQELFLNRKISYSIWGKLYKKEILCDSIFYNTYEFSIGEDLLFNLSLSNKCLKISYIDNCLYYYRLRKSSTSSSKFITLDYFMRFRNKYENIFSLENISDDIKNTIIDDSRYGIVGVIGLPLFYNYNEFNKISDFLCKNKPTSKYTSKLSCINKLFIFFLSSKYIPRRFVFYFFRFIYMISNRLVSRNFYK